MEREIKKITETIITMIDDNCGQIIIDYNYKVNKIVITKKAILHKQNQVELPLHK